MKKFLHSLLMLFMGVTTVAYAQQEEANEVTPWTGENIPIEIYAGDVLTYEYTSTGKGVFYVYSDDQDPNDRVILEISGGIYANGSYDESRALEDAGSFGNDDRTGVYGKILFAGAGEKLRFSISLSDDSFGEISEFTLKSKFVTDITTGSSWTSPIPLEQNTQTALLTYTNTSELLSGTHATYCSIAAPHTGVASIQTEEYIIYYCEKETYGEAMLQQVVQDEATNDHEFVVEKGKTYIVIVPNSRPTDVTFKMNSNRLGISAKFPNAITAFPATLNLVAGDNFYEFSHELIGDNTMMEVMTAAGWTGTITYMENKWGESSKELAANTVRGAATFVKNVDPRYLGGNAVIVNFNTNRAVTSAVELKLREPQEGESFETAIVAKLGANNFGGSARDYWFAYTAETDVEISLTATDSIKHVNFTAGVEQLLIENLYRVDSGETIRICVSATSSANNTLTITAKDVVDGDYCDRPIVFSLGENIVIKDRGDNASNFRQFTAEKSGFAILETTSKNVIDNYWSIYFRDDCDSKTLDYTREETTDASGKVTSRIYKIPVIEGNSYLIEIMSFANDGEDVVFTTRFEEANRGDVCATAIELSQLGDTIKIDNTPETTIWHKYLADKSGFYTTYAKIGRGSNLRIKIGDCDAEEINATEDSRYNNAYMAGYKVSKVYVEEGVTLYIGVTINSDPGDTDGTNYYIVPTFAEARPGERFADAIRAEMGVDYTLSTGSEGYDAWYTFTQSAGELITITISSTVKNYSNLLFYLDEKVSLSAYKKDYTQTNIVNSEGMMVGKNYTFPILETGRTVYIKAPKATIAEPVVWQIMSDKYVAVEEVTLNHTTVDLVEGDRLTLSATITPANATNKIVAWSSSNTAVASVDKNGEVTAVAAGTANITAKVGGKEATCIINVEKKIVAVSGIMLNHTSDSLAVGKSLTLTATVVPEDATDKSVIWTTSDNTVATVANGLVTAVKAGTVTITATAGDYSAICTIIVVDGGTVGIDSVQVANRDEQVFYDLMGRKVTAVGKGIYIVNGKKVVIK